MRTHEIPIVDEANYPHIVLKCLTCSLLGVELDTLTPEGENEAYTEGQIHAMDSQAETHNRSKHQGLGHVRAYNYKRA